MSEVPEDWVLLEAAMRTNWSDYNLAIGRFRQEYGVTRSTFRALCDMIAKYEQPPVDPDVEAVHRILSAWYENADFHHMDYANPGAFNAAVAQYKLERAK